MSFFDDTQKLGLVLLIVGVLSIISAIFMIACGFVDLFDITIGDETLDGSDKTIYCVVGGIGSLIGGIIYFLYAKQVRSGAISAKIDVLATYVRTVGVVYLITHIFAAAATAAIGEVAAGIIAAIVGIIIALIIIFIAGKVNDGGSHKIIWILLVIAFILMLIVSILSCLSIVGIIEGICGVLIALFMLGFLFDGEVKSQMGM